MDYTDAFDARLEQIQSASANGQVLSHNEADAAVLTYERVRTALAICSALLPDASPSHVVTLAAELGAAARHLQRERSDE
jgi:hypothetical protein